MERYEFYRTAIIWYNLVSKAKQAEVTSSGGTEYSGSITLPATVTHNGVEYGVTSIGYSAFHNCSSLKELTLGKGLKKTAAGAFNDCTELEKVTTYATQPPSIEGIGNALFSDATYENTTLYVPQGYLDKYEMMTGWGGFYTIDAEDAKAVCEALKPRIVIPMHYRHDGHGLAVVAGVEPFLALWDKEAVHREESNTIAITPEKGGVWVPTYHIPE